MSPRLSFSLLVFLTAIAAAALGYPPQYDFTSPGAIQINAFSLKGKILQLNPQTLTDAQQISADSYELTFTDPETYKTIIAHVKPAFLAAIKNSDVLYIRVIDPEQYQTEIEILGNAIRHDDLDHPPDRIIWAN